MKTMLFVCLVAVCAMWDAPPPVTGTWEGRQDGRKAITLTVEETDGFLGGSVVFYIMRDRGDGSMDGTPLPPEKMIGTNWDGKVLRFQTGAAEFEFRLTDADRGELKVATPEHSSLVTVTRRK